MKKVTMKRALSLALAAAMTVSVCSTVLAEDAVPDTESTPAASEAAQPEQEAPAEPAAVQAESEAEETEAATPEQPDESEALAEQETVQEVETQEAQSTENEQAAEFAAEEEVEQPAVKVGETEYATLQEAVASVTTGTITLQKDITVTEKITIAENKDITIDLNGNKISVGNQTNIYIENPANIEVVGKLLLKDSSQEQTGTIVANGDNVNCIIVNGENAEFTLESGTLEQQKPYDAISCKSGKTTILGGTLKAMATPIVSYGTLIVSGGRFYGTSIFGDGLLCIMDGTAQVSGGEFYLESYSSKKDCVVTVFEDAGMLTINGGLFNGKLTKDNMTGKLMVSGGLFTNKVSSAYIAEGLACVDNDDEIYKYTIGEPKQPETEIAKPANTVEENKELPENIKQEAEKAASEISVSDESSDAVQKAAAAEAEKIVNKNTVQQAEIALRDAGITYDPDTANVRIVTEPQLKVQPKAVKSGESIQFDISLQYAIKATIAENNGDMNENNTVTLDTDEVKNPPEMVIELNDVRVAEISAKDEELFVKHEHGENTFYYIAEDVKRDESGYVTGLKFTNPNGFSAFTLLSDTRTVTLNEVNADGTVTAHTLRLNHVSSTLPYTAKDGYTFAGYQYTDADGNVQSLGKVLTDEMLSQLNGQTLNVTAVYTQNPSGSSSSSSSSSYVAPDDSVYYTCVKCGYHDWTATADGYQCDHCSYKEVVKQIAGYEHVKGVYEPVSTQQANAKALSVSATASPKSGDNTNLALAVAALAVSLAGVGALVFLRKKNH